MIKSVKWPLAEEPVRRRDQQVRRPRGGPLLAVLPQRGAATLGVQVETRVQGAWAVNCNNLLKLWSPCHRSFLVYPQGALTIYNCTTRISSLTTTVRTWAQEGHQTGQQPPMECSRGLFLCHVVQNRAYDCHCSSDQSLLWFLFPACHPLLQAVPRKH